MKDKDRLQICWQAFSMENSLLQNYRMLFMMMEAALLAFAYAFGDKSIAVPVIGWEVPIIWIGAGFGWAVVGVWIRACEAKGKDVDRWMARIRGFQSLVEKDWPIACQGWFDYLEPVVPKRWFLHPMLWLGSLRALLSGGRVTRFMFNYVMPISIGVLWLCAVGIIKLGWPQLLAV